MLFTKQNLSVEETGLFSGLFNNYLKQDDSIKPFYEFHFDKRGFESFISSRNFDKLNRGVLVEAILKQANLVTNTSSKTIANINLLANENTYTVTTGHQLCLFTGPMYFVVKIISTINLAKALQQQFPDKHFVPVYWMASEDHDFEEINHIHTFGKKLIWETEQKGSVGEFNTSTVNVVLEELKQVLGDNENAKELITLFEKSYLNHTNLADATRYLVNELFAEYGLVVVDGNDIQLKSLFKDEFKQDIFEEKSFGLVSQTINQLKEKYNIQVNPREINVFYKTTQLRERIERDGDVYKVVNTNIVFTKQQLENIIENETDKLSPNVVLRPVYQQKILPNIAYVGGPGELAYWLEFKAMFNTYDINFPVLTPRHFVMLVDKGTQNKMNKLNLTLTDVFKDGEDLVKRFIKTQHADVHLETEKQKLIGIYADVLKLVEGIDKTLVGSTEAEKQKALNGLATLEQKVNRALKQKSETDINQIWSVKGKLFPNNTPQERWDNFTMYYTKYGKALIENLAVNLGYDLKTFDYIVLSEN